MNKIILILATAIFLSGCLEGEASFGLDLSNPPTTGGDGQCEIPDAPEALYSQSPTYEIVSVDVINWVKSISEVREGLAITETIIEADNADLAIGAAFVSQGIQFIGAAVPITEFLGGTFTIDKVGGNAHYDFIYRVVSVVATDDGSNIPGIGTPKFADIRLCRTRIELAGDFLASQIYNNISAQVATSCNNNTVTQAFEPFALATTTDNVILNLSGNSDPEDGELSFVATDSKLDGIIGQGDGVTITIAQDTLPKTAFFHDAPDDTEPADD